MATQGSVFDCVTSDSSCANLAERKKTYNIIVCTLSLVPYVENDMNTNSVTTKRWIFTNLCKMQKQLQLNFSNSNLKGNNFIRIKEKFVALCYIIILIAFSTELAYTLVEPKP